MSDSSVVVETHDPALRHHFATIEQQKRAASLGMWLFLSTEIMFFGGMFCAYLIYRYWYFTEFAASSRTLDIWLGTINTAVLICSSLTVALAVRAAQMGKRKLLVILLLATLVFGLAFWESKESSGTASSRSTTFPVLHSISRPRSRSTRVCQSIPQHAQLFFSLYFAMTGMHALHMIIGSRDFRVLDVPLPGRAVTRRSTTRPLRIAGLYWHFVDIVWIYLFPLLYLIDRKK